MAGRHPSLEGASGENVELVYGQAADGRMLHISTVPSGAACQCTCPACHMPLVAKKGGERAHHFSHASRTNCSSAPETALHKVAKEIISDELRLFLPELKVSLEGRSEIIRHARHMQFEKAVSEDTSLKGIIPDLVLWASERPVFVEIMVTHPCTPEKLAFLKERDQAALEIDLSGIARDADRDVILEAVIESAPRHWVFNPISEGRLSEMRARLERDRMEAEQKTLAVELALIDQYAEGVRALASSQPVALGEQDWIRRLGLENILGLRVAGFGCFANAPSVWQNRILSEILRRHSAGAGDLRANDALKMLRDERALRDPFRFVAKEMEDRLCAREPGFLSPYRSIEAYLEGLIVAGVLKKQRGTYTLSSELARRLEALAASDRRKAERRKTIMSQVARILDRIPEAERQQLTVDDWVCQPVQPFGISFVEAIDQDWPAFDGMAATLDQIERMISSGGPICDSDLGLPISGLREREIDKRRRQQEERKKAREDAARIAGEHRRGILEAELLKRLGKEALIWAEGQKMNLGGRDVLAVAQESEQGLRQVLDALDHETAKRERQQRVQQRIESFRARLEEDAIKALGPQRGKLFLISPYPELKRQKPLDYCRDEATLAECRAFLEKVRRAKR